MLEEEGGDCEVGDGEGAGLEEAELEGVEEEEGDVGYAGLGEGYDGV